MKIDTMVTGAFDVNCYILHGTDHRAIVVDPGADASAIIAALHQHGLSVAAFLLTHGHADHLGALAEVAAVFPAPIHITATDGAWAFSPLNQILPFYGPPAKPSGEWVWIEDNQTVDAAGLTCKVIASPGHSPGGVCFYFEKDEVLISGDTLFKGSVGRSDLKGGDPRVLSQSLARLATLPGSTRVYPGHGASTTMAEEKTSNFFLRGARKG